MLLFWWVKDIPNNIMLSSRDKGLFLGLYNLRSLNFWIVKFHIAIDTFQKINLEQVYMRPEVNSNRFEISNDFEMFRLRGNFTVSNLEISSRFHKLSSLHGDFTAATFKTIARFYCTCANDADLINAKQMLRYCLFFKQY